MFYFKDDGLFEIKNQPCLIGVDLWNEFNLGMQSDFFKNDKSYDDILHKKELLNNFISDRILKMLKYRRDYKATYLLTIKILTKIVFLRY